MGVRRRYAEKRGKPRFGERREPTAAYKLASGCERGNGQRNSVRPTAEGWWLGDEVWRTKPTRATSCPDSCTTGIPMTPIIVSKSEPYQGFACEIEVDEYVPLRFSLREASLGSAYLRIGNYSTSLAELKVNRLTRVLQGLTLTCFTTYSHWPDIPGVRQIEGLPVLTGPWDVPERDLPTLEYKNVDMNIDFSVSLRDSELIVFWGDLSAVSSGLIFDHVHCYIRENQLIGVRFAGLTDVQVSTLAGYGKKKSV